MLRVVIGPDDRKIPGPLQHENQYEDIPGYCFVDSQLAKHYVELSDFLASSISKESLKDLEWYFETFPIHDPFSASRAEGIAAQLILNGEEIVRQFLNSLLLPLESCTDLEIIVQSCPNDLRYKWIDLMCWEILEDTAIWARIVESVPNSVRVLRRFKAVSLDSNKSTEATKSKRILAISARPAIDRDVPHRLITRAILRAVQRHRVSHPKKASVFEIVRPGTIDALATHLKSNTTYDVVHIDVHGISNEKGTFLEFVKFDGFKTFTDPISPTKLAQLLSKHGVKKVFLNACRSAVTSTAQASVAQVLMQYGIQSVIGMSYNIGTTAAEIFVESFYTEYLRPENSIVQASAAARTCLRQNQSRATKFGEFIDMEDHIVPILYHSAHIEEPNTLELSSLVLEEEFPYAEPNRRNDPTCIGRENHILALESFVSRNIPVLLHGQAGSGKTSILTEVSHWWQETALIKGTVFIQASELQSPVLACIQRELASSLNVPVDTLQNKSLEELADLIRDRKLLFVIDSMESLQPEDEVETQNLIKKIKQFLRQACPHMVIVASRDHESWLSGILQWTHVVKGLDERDAVKFGLGLMLELEPQGHELGPKDSRFFTLSMSLVSGYPLAIQILVRMYKNYLRSDPSLDYQQFYLRLLSLDVLNYHDACSEWATHDGARSAPVIQQLIEKGFQAHSYGQRMVSAASAEVMQDILQFAPFWLLVPAEIEEYWLYLGLSMRRVIEGKEAAKKQSLQSGDATQSYKLSHPRPELWAGAFDDGEFELLMGRTALDHQDFGLPGEVKASHEWFRRIQEASKLYFIRGPITKKFRGRRKESLKRQFYTINPVFTLIARSYQRPKLPYWREVVLGSFRRYMFSRVSRWAVMGPSNWSWLPENDLAREQVRYDFANYAASSRASIWTESFRGEEWAYKQMRVLNVAASDYEPAAWAALAIYEEFFKSSLEFVRVEKRKALDANRSGFDESKFTELTKAAADYERYCIVLLADCNILAQKVGDSSSEYRELDQELHIHSISNHPLYSTPEERSWNELCFHLAERKHHFSKHPNPKTLDDITILMKEFRNGLEKRTSRAAEYWDPKLIGTPVGEAFGRISIGGPNSFHERYNALSTSLSVTDEVKPILRKRLEIENVLQQEISGTNLPLNRWHLYYILAEFCRLTGDSRTGRQHQQRYLALEPMVDSELLSIQKKTMDFWLEYHGRNSWDLLEPPEDEDISSVIQRLHSDTEAAREQYISSDLELQDCIFAEAGAREKARDYGRAAMLLSELPEDYRFISRSSMSILGPQHHIALLLMQQGKYVEAEVKLRGILALTLNDEQKALALIGLGHCIFIDVQKTGNSTDRQHRQRLMEAKDHMVFALEQRKLTVLSWHREYLVPQRVLAQILSFLGTPEEVIECRRIMKELQARIQASAHDINNSQRLLNLNRLGNFLLRSEDYEEAEQLFELLYVSSVLQKGENDPITLNCEINLVAALKGQGLPCDATFVKYNQKLKSDYHGWRQTLIKYPERSDVVDTFTKCAGNYLGFLVRHAGHDKVYKDLQKFQEEHNAFIESHPGQLEHIAR